MPPKQIYFMLEVNCCNFIKEPEDTAIMSGP